MRGKHVIGTVAALAPLLAFAPPSYSQGGDNGIYWHIDPSVKTCSMVIDPSLTQAQWHTFTRQAAVMISYKSLSSAEPLGKLYYTFGIDYSITPVDQHDPAWINTFTHPDASCPLGDRIRIPTVRASVGVSSRMDVGALWTTAPRANYGLVGAEIKYAFLSESARIPAAAISTSVTTLTGVPDFNFNVYSIGLTASKRIARFTPYLGARNHYAVATETTSKVDLHSERLGLSQGFVGAGYSIWRLGLAAEYSFADVNTFVFAMGFHPQAR